MKRNFFRICAVCTVFALTMSGCSGSETDAVNEKVLLSPVHARLEMAQAKVGDLNHVSVYSGEVIPDMGNISFDRDGYLSGVFVTAGEEVEEGRVIAAIVGKDNNRISNLEDSIESLEEQNKSIIEYLEADVRLARLNGDDTEELEMSLRHSMEMAQLQVEQKQKKLEELKNTDIGYTYVTAPCDCRIIATTSTRNGGFVGEGTSVACIEGDGPLKVTCEFINEKTIGSLHEYYAVIHGERYELEYVPYTKEEIARMSSSGDEMVSVFILKGVENDKVQIGDYAAVITVSDYVENVLTVPINAVTFDPSGNYVYEVVDGIRVKKIVTTGASDEANIEIISGIEEGAYVYVKN